MPNNATKVISIAIVLTMVVGAFAVLMTGGIANNTLAKSVEVADVEPMDIDPQMKSWNPDIGSAYGLDSMGLRLSAPGDFYDIGAIERFYVGDYGKWAYNETNASNLMLFEKRAERASCEVWVATDLLFLEGDPRNDGRVVISNAQANYIADQFNDTIYPIMTGSFGAPPANDGSNSIMELLGYPYFETNVTGRVMIMIFNIVDDSFFDPGYPSYVVGYFSPSMDYYYDRNIIHIDCYDWDNRTTGIAPRPYVYESTVAHEYQHLLNDFHNPSQATFLNEGCSMYAEMLCGYGVPWDHIEWFLATPDNSLIEWGDQGDLNILADYGGSALYVIWLHDHFGDNFIVKLVNSTYGEEVLSGIDDVNAAFQDLGFSKWDFDRSFNSWRLANLIHDDSPGAGLYDYTSLDISFVGGPLVNSYDPANYYPQSDSPWIESAAWEFGKTVTHDGAVLDSGKVNSYGTDYIRVQPSGYFGGFEFLKFGFVGDTEVQKGWQVIDMPETFGDVLFSDDFNHGGALPGWSMYSDGNYSSPWQAIQNVWTGDPDDYIALADGDIDPALYHVIDEWMVQDDGFSTAGYDHLVLTLENDFQTYFKNDQFGVIYFSIDGGSTWKALASFTSDSVARYIRYPFANGYANVMINADDLVGFDNVQLAFRYVTENKYGNSRWWAFDNLAVTAANTTKVWWSDRGDLVDYSLIGDVDLGAFSEEGQINLTFDAKWNLEEDWDFAFVQVSTDGGETWESLENDNTTYDAVPEAYPTILENLPGITGQSGNWSKPGWAAMETVTFNLSAYAGQVIKLRFREITDWSTNYDGLYIKNVAVNGVIIDNADDVIAFEPDPAYQEESWFVSIFATTWGSTSYDGVYYLPVVLNLNVLDTAEVQRAMDSLSVYTDIYFIVSPQIGPADYGFGMYHDWPYVVI